MCSLEMSNLSGRPIAAEGELRRSGIPCVGDVPWGAHICHVYAGKADLLEILTPYFREGLLSNEYCIWVTSPALGAEEAEAALRAATPQLDHYLSRGQLEILDYTEWYTPTGRFDGERVNQGWLEKLDRALRRGFDGMRLSGDTYWLGSADWERFVDYEAQLDPVIGARRVLAICTYAASKCGMREIFDAMANHDFALIREQGRWTTFKSQARRRSENVLKESEARLRAMIDGASDGIVAFDETGAIALANAAASHMFGYQTAELSGARLSSLLAGALGAGEACAGLGETRIGEGRRQDGALFPMEWTVREAALERGPRLFVGFARNLTEQRETEARLQKIDLDRMAAMGGMATALTHELNQPLTAAATYLKAAQRLLQMPREQRPASVENTLGSAAAQAMRASDILRRLREFVVRGEPDKTVWSLHELIIEVCRVEDAQGDGVRTALELRAASDWVIADREQIRQVIANLARNAVEAMRGSPVRELTVSTASDGAMIEIGIRDTGAGLPENFNASAVEPFVTTKPSGMGVGLSMSRSIVAAHYGELWARPNPGGGAVMSFTLPLAEADRAEHALEQAARPL